MVFRKETSPREKKKRKRRIKKKEKKKRKALQQDYGLIFAMRFTKSGETSFLPLLKILIVLVSI